jgi:hypothetical protein
MNAWNLRLNGEDYMSDAENTISLGSKPGRATNFAGLKHVFRAVFI